MLTPAKLNQLWNSRRNETLADEGNLRRNWELRWSKPDTICSKICAGSTNMLTLDLLAENDTSPWNWRLGWRNLRNRWTWEGESSEGWSKASICPAQLHSQPDIWMMHTTLLHSAQLHTLSILNSTSAYYSYTVAYSSLHLHTTVHSYILNCSTAYISLNCVALIHRIAQCSSNSW